MSKLVELLKARRYTIERAFTYKDIFYYLEVINNDEAVSLLLDVHNYKFSYSSKYNIVSYQLSKRKPDDNYIDLENNMEFTGSQTYEDITNEDDLVNGYRPLISISGSNINQQERIRSNYRQAKRLALCMAGVDYKLSIFDEDILVVSSSEKINVFIIKKYRSFERKIILSLPIDNFYKQKSIGDEIHSVFLQVYSLLNKNQEQQTIKIQALLDARKNVAEKSVKILKKKEDYIRKYERLLSQYAANITKDKELEEKIVKLETSKNKTYADDTERVTNKAHLEDQRRELFDSREKITGDMSKIRNDLHDLMIVVDRIMFDNIAMLLRINNNFTLLEKI